MIDRPVNALAYNFVADSRLFTQRNFVADFFKVQFQTENGHSAFLSPVWGLRGNV